MVPADLESETHFFEKFHDDLSMSLGKAVWSFARIEWICHAYMKKLSCERLDVLIGDQGFAARIRVIKILIDRIEGHNSEKANALRFLNAADELSSQRNTIVHNPWRIWIDLECKEFKSEIQKYSNKKKTLNLTQVDAFSNSAWKVSEELENALAHLPAA